MAKAAVKKDGVKVPGVDSIDPDGSYRVTLFRPIKYRGVILSPRNEVTVSGRALAEIAKAVQHADPQS